MMSEIHFIEAEEASERVRLITQRVLDFLAEFNALHPDENAADVSPYFDYFTPNYISQTCASVIAEKRVPTTAPSPREGQFYGGARQFYSIDPERRSWLMKWIELKEGEVKLTRPERQPSKDELG